MAFKLRADNGSNKQYLMQSGYGANGIKEWIYVTTDAPATVDGSGYIDDSTDDGETALGMLEIGDKVWVYQVGSVDDAQPIQDDLKGGITDLSLHLVLDNTGSVIDLSDDLLSATVTYGD